MDLREDDELRDALDGAQHAGRLLRGGAQPSDARRAPLGGGGHMEMETEEARPLETPSGFMAASWRVDGKGAGGESGMRSGREAKYPEPEGRSPLEKKLGKPSELGNLVGRASRGLRG
ncbi:unknown [Equid alphaherpesvirus 9]|uniref:Uncharacterized protein n=1 Tax=Equid alphaherpesvirus 9 TaxID=55744 RepID=B7FEE2_9ALPH|nr:unknown [Equid alphaherpesvirus 9]